MAVGLGAFRMVSIGVIAIGVISVVIMFNDR